MKDEDLERDLEGLYDLMEQQIAGYRRLLEEVKSVSKHLRPVSPESLMRSFGEIGKETNLLVDLGKKTEETIGQMLRRQGREGEERSLSHLLRHLPSVHRQRVGLYQQTLTRLRRWVEEVNGRNRALVAESLSLVKHLLSLFLDSVKGAPVYSKNGQTRPLALSARSLDRRVE